MFDLSADLMLGFSYAPVLFFITFIGSLFWGRSIFFQTACLLALDIILNVALKGTFKIPLSPTLHKAGYALPSGHMQMATVFYIWWAFFIPGWTYRAIALFILIGVGAGLIHYNYHDGYDVVSGFFVGALFVSGYYYLLIRQSLYFARLLLGISSILMVCNALLYKVVPLHAWIAYGAIMILILSERLVFKSDRSCRYFIKKGNASRIDKTP
jgi:undecaprenyl-diphosphatase